MLSFMLHKKKYCYGEGQVKESHSLSKEAAFYSGGTAADTAVSPARQQQGEQAVPEEDVVRVFLSL